MDGLRGLPWFALMAAFWTAAGLSLVFLGGLAVTASWRFDDLLKRQWTRTDVLMTILSTAAIGALVLAFAAVVILRTCRSPQRFRERLDRGVPRAFHIVARSHSRSGRRA